MLTCGEIIKCLEQLAPPSLAESWDNVGLQVGFKAQPVDKVMVALDLTLEVAKAAVEKGVHLIVVHHPLILKPLASLCGDQSKGALLSYLILNQISVYVMHTNLDSAKRGLGYYIGALLQLQSSKVLVPLTPEGETGIGRVGELSAPITLKEFVAQVKEALHCPHVTVVGDMDQKIQKIAVVNGSGADYISLCYPLGVEVLVTGDVKYHQAQMALEYGISLIDASHFHTEKQVTTLLSCYLQEKFSQNLDIIAYEAENIFEIV